MTNLEKIRQRSLEEVAQDIYYNDDKLMSKICLKCCPYGDEVERDDCISCVKQWLLKED